MLTTKWGKPHFLIFFQYRRKCTAKHEDKIGNLAKGLLLNRVFTICTEYIAV